MDVAVVSSPTNAAGAEADVCLYRLGGTSSSFEERHVYADPDIAAVSPAQIWQTNVHVDVFAQGAPAINAAIPSGTAAKKRTSGSRPSNQAADAFVAPRLPESVAWRPDGKILAFASSVSNLSLLSVHDGKFAAPRISASQTSTTPPASSMYLLGWEDCLPSDQVVRKLPCTAESLVNMLPRLPSEKVEAPKANKFLHPFNMAQGKPFEPVVQLSMPPLPTLPFSDGVLDTSDSADEVDDEDGAGHATADDANRWMPTVLLSGDENGHLHVFIDGAIHAGSVSLGKQTDIISASIAGLSTTKPSALSPSTYSLCITLLLSVPISALKQDSSVPEVIRSAITTSSQQSDVEASQAVIHCLLDLPHLPSQECSLLARASSSIRFLLDHAFSQLEAARRSWEEASEVRARWLSRLDDDSPGMSGQLQLLLLLLTGRPVSSDLHEYLAAKNTERNFEKWESLAVAALVKLRNFAYQSLTPVCERIMIWLDQLQGWAAWPERFGHLQISKRHLDECSAIIRLLMMNAAKLETAAVEEELAFREFTVWMKWELERISNLEANAETRSAPKHDVVAVTGYIKDRLTYTKFSKLVTVEIEAATTRYDEELSGWIDWFLTSSSIEVLSREGSQALPHLMRMMRKEYGLSDHSAEETDQTPDDMENNARPSDSVVDEIPQLSMDRLLLDPPTVFGSTRHTPNTRRKSGSLETHQEPIVVTDLPIPYYLQQLAKRFAAVSEHSFSTITQQAVLRDATHVVTWQPPDREEDDSMSALGLARDPTKITSRVMRSDSSPNFTRWVVCETTADILGDDDQQPAFWVLRIEAGRVHRGAAFALRHRAKGPFDILDLEFFDDSCVALLLRLASAKPHEPKYMLATVRYQGVKMQDLPSGSLKAPKSLALEPVPIDRIYEIGGQFDPLQIAMNGREGRRIGCILGNLGRALLVLDMEEDDPEGDHARRDSLAIHAIHGSTFTTGHLDELAEEYASQTESEGEDMSL